jgi:hypothetical protein
LAVERQLSQLSPRPSESACSTRPSASRRSWCDHSFLAPRALVLQTMFIGCTTAAQIHASIE